MKIGLMTFSFTVDSLYKIMKEYKIFTVLILVVVGQTLTFIELLWKQKMKKKVQQIIETIII